MQTLNGGQGDGTTFSWTDLTTSPDIIARQAIYKLWGETRDMAPLASLTNLSGSRGKFGGKRSIKTKKPVWGVGDYFKETSEVFANFTQTVSTWDTSIDLGHYDAGGNTVDNSFVKGDLIQLVDTAGLLNDDGLTTDETGFIWAVCRIDSVGASGVYDVIVLNQSMAAADSTKTNAFLPATTIVYKISSATDYDAEARKWLGLKPEMMSNVMQRARDTIGQGDWAMSEHFVVDMTLEHQTRHAFNLFATKQNLQLYGNQLAKSSASGSQDYGTSGGYEYFYNGFGHTMSSANVTNGLIASANYAGINVVSSSTTFTAAVIEAWVEKLIKKGSKTKVIVGSPTNIKAIYNVYRAYIAIQRENVKGLMGLDADLFKLNTIDLPFGSIQLLVDYSIGSMTKHIAGNQGGGLSVDTTEWVMAVDVTQIAKIALEVNGQSQMPHVRDIAKINNDSITKVEIDATDTLAVGDPETGGFLALS